MSEAPAVAGISPQAWDRYSPSVQAAVSVTPSGGDTTYSEDLLVGTMLSHPGYSEVEQLLRHVGLSSLDLAEVKVGDRLGAAARRPDDIRLSPNAARILERAEALASATPSWRDRKVHMPHIFGGVLDVEESVAHQAVASALAGRVDMARLSREYADFVAMGPDSRFEDFLAQRFPLEPEGRGLPDLPVPVGREALVEQLAQLLTSSPGGPPDVIVAGEPEFGTLAVAVEAARRRSADFSEVVFLRYPAPLSAIPPGALVVYDGLATGPNLLPHSEQWVRTVLVTRRISGERTPLDVEVGPLEEAGAAELVASIVGEAAAADEPEAVATLIGLAEGVPEALELLARNAIRSGPASLAERSAWIRQFYEEAVQVPAVQVPDTVREAYATLTGVEKTALWLLSRLPDFSPAEAGALLDGAPAPTLLSRFSELGLATAAAPGRLVVVPPAAVVADEARPEGLRAVVESARIAALRLGGAGALRFTRGLARLAADDTSGQDRLGFEQDVEALCEVLIATDTTPPVSVGLFGEWGTGKSFFMRMMRESIRQRSLESRAATARKEPSAFCAHVRQITFNAWHYVDANLWASLVTHVFERLASPTDDEDEVQRQVDADELQKLAGALQTGESMLQEANAQHRAAAAETEKAEKDLASLRMRRSVVAEVLAAASGDPKQLSCVVDTFLPTVDEADRRVITELAASSKNVLERSRWKRLKGGAGQAWASRRELAAVTALLTVGALLFWYTWSHVRLFAVLGAASTGVVSIVLLARPFIAGAAEAARIARKARETRDRCLREAGAHLERLQQKEEDLVTAAREAETRRRATERQIEEIRSGRRVFRFIQERAGSTDYQQYLGLIALVRRDFHRLSVLLRLNREAREKGEAVPEPDLPELDRIVLYIDDLDRCPSDKVVQVLEAVHLLLAFDLFVVVVGVDPRWLVTSLRRHHGTQLADGEDGGDWTATPQNYLEKIFQLPIALRPMEKAGFGRLVSELFKERSIPQRARASTTPEVIRAEESPQDVADPVSTPQDERSPSPPEPHTFEAPPPARYEQDPVRLKFQKHEVEFLKLLHPAIPTPRAAKRLVNTYRLIKATLSPGELDAFIGGDGKPGEHRLVMLLLALMIGDPTRAPAKFHATAAQPRSRIQAILAPALQATVANEVIPDDPDLRRKWLRVVARYSFQAVLEEAEAPTPRAKAKKRVGPRSARPDVDDRGLSS